MDNLKNNNPRHSNILEGLEQDDLARLVHNELHVDEYKSKMGNDEDMVVVSFKVGGKDPAVDLVNFIEKGYQWVIDADTSSGEMDDGDFIVFVELERTPNSANNIINLLLDLKELCGVALDEWRVIYHNSNKEYGIKSLKSLIPKTPYDYLKKVSKDTEALDKLKAQAGVDIKTKAPNNDFTEGLRLAAGLL